MPKPLDRRTGEALVAIVLLVVGLAAVALAWRMPAGTVAQPGPRVFPAAIGAGLAVVALLLLAQQALGRAEPAAVEVGHHQVMVTLALLALAAFGLERLGAPATFALFLLVLLRTLAGAPWWLAAIAALAGAAAAWVIFTSLLGVRLPWLPG